MFDIEKKEIVKAIELKENICNVKFSADSNLIAAGSALGVVLSTDSLSTIYVLEEHYEKITKLSFSLTGLLISVGTE